MSFLEILKYNVFQIGVREKLTLSLDTSDTLVELVAKIFLIERCS